MFSQLEVPMPQGCATVQGGTASVCTDLEPAFMQFLGQTFQQRVENNSIPRSSYVGCTDIPLHTS